MNLAQLQQYAGNRNVKAFLDTIAHGEGANYNTYYGGGTFNNSGAHPCRVVTAGRYRSTAAGRYQFLCETWRGLVSRYGFSSMSSVNQDLGAIALIADNGGLTKIVNGDFEGAVKAVRAIWPSLPGGKQQTRTWAQASAFFARAGGGTVSPSAQANESQQAASDTDPGNAGSDYLGEPGTNTFLVLAAAGIALYFLFK